MKWTRSKMDSTTSMLLFFIALWYAAASLHHVASQHLRGSVARLLLSSSPNQHCSPWPCSPIPSLYDAVFAMAVLTSIQLTTGAFIVSAILYSTSRFTRATTENNNTTCGDGDEHVRVVPWSPTLSSVLLLGALHCTGGVTTNLGYLYGSASLVQLVTVLEPLETLLVGYCATRTCLPATASNLITATRGQLVATMVIVAATTIIVTAGHNSSSATANVTAIAFSMLSGVMHSTRNIMQKTDSDGETWRSRASSSANGTSIVVHQLSTLAWLSSVGAVILLIVAVVMGVTGCATLSLERIFTALRADVMMAHAAYNLFSMLVLGFVDAPTHALLNMGKHAFAVLVALFVFQEHVLNIRVVMALVIIIFASLYYRYESNAKASATTSAKWPRFRALVATALALTVTVALVSTSTFLTRDKETVQAATNAAAQRERILIYVTTHMSKSHLRLFEDCWPESLKQTKLLQQADVLVYAGGPATDDTLQAWDRALNRLPVRHARIVHEVSNPGYVAGAIKAIRVALDNHWFDEYDWVVRTNPDVIFTNVSWLEELLVLDSISGVFADCKRESTRGKKHGSSDCNFGGGYHMIHTDFFAVRPLAIPIGAFELPEASTAECATTAEFLPIVEAGKAAWLPNGVTGDIEFCRMVGTGSGIVHTHQHKGCPLGIGGQESLGWVELEKQ